jgi:Protein of unknown function (DUF4238)
MNVPKLHHYVPQFYLRRFTDATGHLWLWDRDQDRAFRTRPNGVAAENNFYWHEELAALGHDPLTMEKQFSQLEGEVARITGQWVEWLRDMKPMEKVEVPDINRELVSLYVALQFLRTADARDILATFAEQKVHRKPVAERDKRLLHLGLLWEDSIFEDLAERIRNATWLFGRNLTAIPFITSDNPVAFRTGNNAMWLKVGVYSGGTYSVFPMAPDIVMYCYPKEPPWRNSAGLTAACRLWPSRKGWLKAKILAKSSWRRALSFHRATGLIGSAISPKVLAPIFTSVTGSRKRSVTLDRAAL